MAYTHAIFLGVLLLCSIILSALARRSRLTYVLLTLLVLHPAWTISAIHGDCGDNKRDVSEVFTVLGAVAICWQWGKIIQGEVRVWLGRRAGSDSATQS